MSEKIAYQPTPENSTKEGWLKELEKTRNDILRFIYSKKMRLSREEIEDVVQQTMLKATEAIQAGKFVGGSPKLKTWLGVIAERTAFDFLRKRKRRSAKTGGEMISLSSYHEHVNSEPTSEEKLITEEEDKNLKSLRNNLPEKQREVLDLFESGKSLEEIAKLKNISPNTVRSRKRYALQSLRESMKNEGDK